MADTIKCTCTHPFQDYVYGKGNRVFTTSTKGFPLVNRCTVCGRTQVAEKQSKAKGAK
jgi:hypothetical protein